MTTAPTQLAVLEEATRMLAECRTVDEAKKIRDLAEAARIYAREQDLGQEAENHAAEIRLRAERRCAQVLADMAINGERDPGGRGRIESRPAIQLSDLGITPNESSRWQKLAKADDATFEQYITDAKEAGERLSTVGAIRYLTPAEKRAEEEQATELFTIYRALEAIAAFEMTPKQWARLDHGSSAYRVDRHLEPAWRWLNGLRDAWQTR